MNYLILTPDGVGSTILQRLLTIALHIENQDVTNTHELTNGLELKNGIAVKNFTLDYSQNLGQISTILQNSNPQTALVSRLAKYHMDARKDYSKDADTFYEFLNSFFTKKLCVSEKIFLNMQ